MSEKRKTICPLDCPDSCALLVTVDKGKVTKVEGDPGHDFTRGFICAKMRSYHQRVESKERILHPLLRTGEKGSGEFKAITWENAWEILVDRLSEIKRKHGGQSVLPYSYAGNMGHLSRTAGSAFFNKFGASHLKETICSAAAKAGWKAHMGSFPGTDPHQARNASLIVNWGSNVKTTNIHFWPMIHHCRKNGGKLLVIDPYKTITAKAADYYFPVKPGGDAALALGALKCLRENKRCDQSFIRSRTTGFDELAAYLQKIQWEALEEASGIDRESIEELAILLQEHFKAFFRIGVGLSRNSRGAMSVRAITCLGLALGLMDGGEGRGMLLFSGAFSGNSAKLSFPELRQEAARSVNMVQLGDALTRLEPKIYGLFVYNSNPLSVAPEASLVKKGLEREELFTVVHEQLMTPTARYADLILPATTSFENSDLYTAYGHFTMGITEPVIPPRGESIDNLTLFQTLARKMGYSDPPFQQSTEERIRDYLSDMEGMPADIDVQSLAPGDYIRSALASQDGKESSSAPFRFVSAGLAADQPAIPSLLPLAEFDDMEIAKHFPLKLITPPNGKLLNSTFGEHHRSERGTILIHPEDASPRNIKEGNPVLVFNQRGSVVRTARVTDETQPELVVAEGIYWEDPSRQIQGINELTSQRTTDLAGGGTFHESRVEVNVV